MFSRFVDVNQSTLGFMSNKIIQFFVLFSVNVDVDIDEMIVNMPMRNKLQ